MARLLEIVGYGWTLLGLYNFIQVYSGLNTELLLSMTIIGHVTLYGPGLIVGGLGTIARARGGDKAPPKEYVTCPHCLAKNRKEDSLCLNCSKPL